MREEEDLAVVELEEGICPVVDEMMERASSAASTDTSAVIVLQHLVVGVVTITPTRRETSHKEVIPRETTLGRPTTTNSRSPWRRKSGFYRGQESR